MQEGFDIWGGWVGTHIASKNSCLHVWLNVWQQFLSLIAYFQVYIVSISHQFNNIL